MSAAVVIYTVVHYANLKNTVCAQILASSHGDDGNSIYSDGEPPVDAQNSTMKHSRVPLIKMSKEEAKIGLLSITRQADQLFDEIDADLDA
ncbi:hypothetical protein BOTCAL_1533g00020 [Botryotinia calthae]|uniref:Uncharacterized protein n=1 Tax=Botryotinia calthae TaxID=38488 RepID=A0A4Y8CCD8_9HELO|nr:hypothetical protein BOTCAL_1533g00020 [Botryotinia calthae]